MEQKPLIKVVAIGPESTGKTTLCELLARHYNTLWCPEYAREYLLKHGMNYNYDNLLFVAKQQLTMEDKYIQSTVHGKQSAANDSPLNTHHSPLLFIDTDMYVMKVWCEFVFDKCHKWILEQIANRSYDLYLLCNIDLPWTQDELREYPDPAPRKKLYQIYKDIMINQSTPWIEISGTADERLQRAIKAVDQLVAG